MAREERKKNLLVLFLPKAVEFTVLAESFPCTWVGSEGRAINLDAILADSICIFDELVR